MRVRAYAFTHTQACEDYMHVYSLPCFASVKKGVHSHRSIRHRLYAAGRGCFTVLAASRDDPI